MEDFTDMPTVEDAGDAYKQPLHPEWSIGGGFYDPEDPATRPDQQRLETIRQEIRHYAGHAHTRFWAWQLVEYALELSGIDLTVDPDAAEDQDLNAALKRDFVDASKFFPPGKDPVSLTELNIQAHMLDQLPVMRALDTIIEADAAFVVDPEERHSLRAFAQAMVAVRASRELPRP